MQVLKELSATSDMPVLQLGDDEDSTGKTPVQSGTKADTEEQDDDHWPDNTFAKSSTPTTSVGASNTSIEQTALSTNSDPNPFTSDPFSSDPLDDFTADPASVSTDDVFTAGNSFVTG